MSSISLKLKGETLLKGQQEQWSFPLQKESISCWVVDFWGPLKKQELNLKPSQFWKLIFRSTTKMCDISGLLLSSFISLFLPLSLYCCYVGERGECDGDVGFWIYTTDVCTRMSFMFSQFKRLKCFLCSIANKIWVWDLQIILFLIFHTAPQFFWNWVCGFG